MADFALNYQRLALIDITPDGASPTYARLAAGISSLTPAGNEDVSQDKYLDGNGFGSSDVIGGQRILTGTGHRDNSDSAQNYIMSKKLIFGDERKTNFKEYGSSGAMLSGEVTICNIEEGQGDAAGKEEIGFELHYNGEPTATDATIAPAALTTIDAGSVVGTTRFSTKVASGNSVRYRLRGATAGTVNANSFVPGLKAYNAGTLQAMSSACTTGAVTTSGNITVAITAACLDGGSDSVVVAVAQNDTPAQVAEKVKVALEADNAAGEVGGEFYITRSGATLTLTAKSAAANDVLYNFTVTDTGTTGVVFAAISGAVAGVVNADIVASAGQYLQTFEVDPYMRVVSFYEKALVSGDIKSA